MCRASCRPPRSRYKICIVTQIPAARVTALLRRIAGRRIVARLLPCSRPPPCHDTNHCISTPLMARQRARCRLPHTQSGHVVALLTVSQGAWAPCRSACYVVSWRASTRPYTPVARPCASSHALFVTIQNIVS